MEFKIQNKLYKFQFQILDEATRVHYMEFEGNRFMIRILQPHSPEPPFNFNNHITYRKLISILKEPALPIYKINKGKWPLAFEEFYLKNLDQPIPKEELIRILEKNRSIPQPIALVSSTAFVDNEKYIMIFDDDEYPKVYFDSWENFISRPRNTHIQYPIIKEEITFQWGSSYAETPYNNTHKNLPDFILFFNDRLYNYKMIDLAEVKSMLYSSPKLFTGDQEIEKFTISMVHLQQGKDAVDIKLHYENGKLNSGKILLETVLKQLEINDNLGGITISVDGQIKLPPINIKITDLK